MLRGLQSLALGRGILFRGAFALGELYHVSQKTNTIMGPAITDAAVWYGMSDWVGVSATSARNDLLRRTHRATKRRS